MRRLILLVATIAVINGCSQLSWVGLPAEAVDTHPALASSTMLRKRTPSGMEIRLYSAGAPAVGCSAAVSSRGSAGWVGDAAFADCSAALDKQCGHLFYLASGEVVDYQVTGSCKKKLRPADRYAR